MSASTLKDSVTSVLAFQTTSNTNSVSSSTTTRKSVTFDLSTYSSDDDDFYERSSSGRRYGVVSLRNTEDLKFELSYVLRSFNLLLFIIYFFLCLNWFLVGSQWLLDTESELEIDCNIPGLQNVTWTSQEINSITKPNASEYQPGCTYYDYNYHLLSLLPYEEAVKAILSIPKPSTIICKDYTFAKDCPEEACFTKEFDLICYKRTLYSDNLYRQYGRFFFSLPSGLLADMYGRRRVHIFCAVVLFTMSIIIPLIKNYTMLVLGKTVVEGCLMSINIILNLTCIANSETCRRRYRMFTTLFAFTWCVIGSEYIDQICQIIEVWRLRELTFALIYLVCLFGAIMIVPESPRYLIAKRQFIKAWDCLDKLGNTESHPEELENSKLHYRLNYQMKILTKSYLRERIVIILILNGIGVYFYHIFQNIALRVLVVDNTNDELKMQFLSIEVGALLLTSGILWIYKKKRIICFYCVLLSMCIVSRMITDTDVVMDWSILSGVVFSEMLIIITYCYIIDIFPTTHRGTAIGFCFSFNSILAILTKIFHDNLTLEREPTFLGALYCGVCITCAAITVISPETGNELADRKHEMFYTLSLEESNKSSSSS